MADSQTKKTEQLAYELYSSYLGEDLGQPLEPWDKLPEAIRGAWRITVKTLVRQLHAMDRRDAGRTGIRRTLASLERRMTMHKDDMYPQEGVAELTMSCQGCGKPLFPENKRFADGCACNAPRGINHGLVPKNTCTCVVCDPAQTGGTRIGQSYTLIDEDIHTEWRYAFKTDMHECRIERLWQIQGKGTLVEFLRDDATHTQNLYAREFLHEYEKKDMSEKFPNGKLGPADQGAGTLTVSEKNGAILIDFGKVLRVLGMMPAEMRAMCQHILAKVDEIEARQ